VRGEKKSYHTRQESESTVPANGALSPGRRYSQHIDAIIFFTIFLKQKPEEYKINKS
jgi:hypothetical protein